jgi:DnaJ-class molecular chaperone
MQKKEKEKEQEQEQEQEREKKLDIQKTIKITLEELFFGTEKKIEYDVNELCSVCEYEKLNICKICLGEGILMNYEQEDVLCPKCFGCGKNLGFDILKEDENENYNGNGVIVANLTQQKNENENKACLNCGTVGYKKVKKFQQIIIPRGTYPNEKIIFKGKGHSQPFFGKNKCGNLIVEIDIWSHHKFEFIPGSHDLFYHYYYSQADNNNKKNENNLIETIGNNKKFINITKVIATTTTTITTKSETMNDNLDLGNYGLFYKDGIHRAKLYLKII